MHFLEPVPKIPNSAHLMLGVNSPPFSRSGDKGWAKVEHLCKHLTRQCFKYKRVLLESYIFLYSL